jgi:hypothetical protein
MHEAAAAAGKLGFQEKNQGFRAFPAVDEPLLPTLSQVETEVSGKSQRWCPSLGSEP